MALPGSFIFFIPGRAFVLDFRIRQSGTWYMNNAAAYIEKCTKLAAWHAARNDSAMVAYYEARARQAVAD